MTRSIRCRSALLVSAVTAACLAALLAGSAGAADLERSFLTTDGLLRGDVLHHEVRRLVLVGVRDPHLPVIQKMVPLLREQPPQYDLVRAHMLRTGRSANPTIRALAAFTLGLVAMAQKKIVRAVERFDQAAWGTGSLPVARLNLAQLALSLNKPQAALEVLGAGPIPPYHGYLALARYHAAQAEAMLGREKDALQSLQSAFFDLSGRPRPTMPVPPDYLLRDPLLNNLRANPDFRQFVFYVLRLGRKE